MKKILILGGANGQVPLIKAAKNEGYYVVLCDWTKTNPGIPMADIHYQVSTLDLNAVMEVAIKENIDGVISNSEAAMYNVACISEKLNLVGNAPSCIEILQSKYRFRDFQKRIGVYAPNSWEGNSFEQLSRTVFAFKYPIIIKPSESSGSRGTTIINEQNYKIVKEHFDECSEFSRDGKVTVEEYVPMPSLLTIEGELFVHKGRIIWNGLYSTLRSELRPFIPQDYIFPIQLPSEKLEIVKKNLSLIVDKSGFKHGQANIEAYFTSNGDLFVIEINARQGGNSLPELVKDHTGIDYCRLLVTTAVGDDGYFNQIISHDIECNNMIGFLVFPRKNGIFKGIHIEPEIKPFVYKVIELVPVGKKVRITENATDNTAIVRLRFSTKQDLQTYQNKLEKLIYPIIV